MGLVRTSSYKPMDRVRARWQGVSRSLCTNCACAETDLTFDLGASMYVGSHWTLPAIFTCSQMRDFNIFNALPEELLVEEVL